MNYDWTNRTYVEGWKSEFPSDLADLCVSLAEQGGYSERFIPEAAIVNFYTPSQVMGPHRDDAELTMEKPIVSISIGCDAVFCIENKPFEKDSEICCLWLRSGDVVIMGGKSREALHGVAVTLPDTFAVDEETNKNLSRDESKLAKALSTMRININVRQVEDESHVSKTFAGRKGDSHTGVMACSSMTSENK